MSYPADEKRDRMPQLDEGKQPQDRHPRFRRLYDYLQAKAPAGKLPGRQHIDPLEIPDLLPYLMLMDVVREKGGEPRYRIRLVGTEVVALQGEDATGKFAGEVLTRGANIVAGYDDILETRRPQHRHGEVATPGREHATYERMAFPLASDGETIDMLIFVFVLDKRAVGPSH